MKTEPKISNHYIIKQISKNTSAVVTRPFAVNIQFHGKYVKFNIQSNPCIILY